MADRTDRPVHRDPDEWTAYGQRGPGRPKVGGEAVNVSLPPAHVAELDAIAAARSVKRNDILREAVAYYLRHPIRPSPETTEENGDCSSGFSRSLPGPKSGRSPARPRYCPPRLPPRFNGSD